jgi:hypothetical protein
MARSRLCFLVSLGVLAAGCGDPAPAPAPALGSCTDAWQPLTARAPLLAPKALAYRDGSLYYFHETLTAPRIAALSIATATESTVIADWAWDLWAEDDHLLYSQGTRFLSVPFSGGAATLLLDWSTPGPSLPGDSFQQIASSTDFFWTQLVVGDGGGTAIRRVSRQGGTIEQLGVVPENIFQGISLVDGGVLLGTDLGVAYVVPFDKGPVRSLDKKGFHYLGLDDAGVYWSSVKNVPDETFDVVRSPIDGSAQTTFWSGLPNHADPYRLWPDGRGGWLVAAFVIFDDKSIHTAIWRIDAQRTGHLVACDPSSGDLTGYVIGRPAFTPDGVFLIIAYYEASGAWGIVHLPW